MVKTSIEKSKLMNESVKLENGMEFIITPSSNWKIGIVPKSETKDRFSGKEIKAAVLDILNKEMPDVASFIDDSFDSSDSVVIYLKFDVYKIIDTFSNILSGGSNG